MKKTRFRKLLAVVVACVAAVVIVARLIRPSGPYNVLLITLDTTRADHLGCYGYEAAITPAIDSLAKNGVLFERAYTCVPLTLPAHATMMTGLQPPEHGLRINGANSLSPSATTLAELLKDQGYMNGAFVSSWVLNGKFGLNQGFDRYEDVDTDAGEGEDGVSQMGVDFSQEYPYRKGAETANAAIEWLKSICAAKEQKPFFCWLHLYDPHYPYHQHPRQFATRFDTAYDAEIAYVDLQIGKIMSFLKGAGKAKNTLIIIVGDHGEGLGEHGEGTHGFMLYDSTIRVPMIFSMPGVVPQGIRVTPAVSIADLFSTILEVLEIKDVSEPLSVVPGTVGLRYPGSSIAALFDGDELEEPVLYAESDQPYIAYRWSPVRSLVTPDWKYVRSPRVELYDREGDPDELMNLAVRYPERVREMEQLLLFVEDRMSEGQVGTLQLTAEERRRLESLGYASGGTEITPRRVGKELPDIKDMIEVFGMDMQVRTRAMDGDMGKETLALCRKMVELSPESPKLHNKLGIMLMQDEQHKQALDHFESALQLQPGYPDPQVNMGIAHYRLGDYDKAIECYSAALASAPDNIFAHNNLSVTLLRLRRYKEAASHCREAIRGNPQYATAYKNLADALAGLGEDAEAVKNYLRALELNPGWVQAMQSAAWLLSVSADSLVRDPVRALPLAWEACEQTSHRDARCLDTLAAAYAAKGNFEKASEYAGKAAAVAGDALGAAIRCRLKLYRARRPYIWVVDHE